MISWSPDGKWIAFNNVPGDEHAMMSLLSTETLETKRIPNGANCLEQGQPAFSHSGDHLAYWCFRTTRARPGYIPYRFRTESRR